ncbi:MAG TPA: hypothetical protein VFG69_09370 [Nannocystaceae bacterium]|nr:hypothetical protein [Nannocystaceae bacterium]
MLKQVEPELDDADSEPDERVIAFASGRTVTLQGGAADRLCVSDPHGRFEVAIHFTADGPVLDVSAIALEMRAQAAVVLDCDRLHVRARESITLESHGDLIERVAGERRTEVEGGASVSASYIKLHADDGAVEIAATEDTRIDGRRVLVNG